MYQVGEEEEEYLVDDFWEELETRWDIIIPALLGIALLNVLIILDPLQWLLEP